MQKRWENQQPYSRERAIYLYVQALDQGDMEVVAQILDAGCDDPELERIITEINSAYQEEAQLIPVATVSGGAPPALISSARQKAETGDK